MSTLPGERSKQPKRSRIVVNVEELQRPSRRGRLSPRRPPRNPRARRRRLLAALAVVALVLLAFMLGSFIWWQSYKAKPAYTLALVLDAARRNDEQAFDALVDIDSVSRSLVPQVINQAHSPSGTSALTPQARRQIEASAAVLLPGARDQLRATMLSQIRDVLARSGAADDSFVVLALAVPRVVEFKPGIDGADPDTAATATLNVNGRPVELDMRSTDEADNRASSARWRIVGVESDELAARVAETLGRVYQMSR